MLDLENEVRRVLHERSEGHPSTPDLEARIARRMHTRVRTRRVTVATLAFAIVAAVALTTAAFVSGRDNGAIHVVPGPATSPTTAARGPVAVEPGHWAAIAEPPMTGAFASVWTGTELVVAFRDTTAVRFAAYDPAHDTWTRIPDPPIEILAPFTDSSTFVWTGHTVLVWGYENHGIGTFSGHHRLLEYDPGTDRWRQLASPPIDTLIQAHPIWTGTELIVWGGNFNGENAPAQGATYDPGTDRWRPIADAPLSTRENPSIVWTGHEMIVWGGVANGQAAADRLEGAAYDPAKDAWRALPASGLPTTELAATVWTGTEMVVFGPSVTSVSLPNFGAAYDPATSQWRRIAAAPLSSREQMAFTWTGREMIVWGGISFAAGRQTVADGEAYDPATNRWQVLAEAPLISRWGPTMGWTGELAIVVGGNGPSAPAAPSEPPAKGAAVYRP